MFRDKTIEVWESNAETTIDEYGTRSKGNPTRRKTFLGTVQPFTRELLLKKYGYDVIVTKVIYCDIDKDIKEHTILKYNDDFYKVKKIMEWSYHMEVFCDKWELQ